MDVRVKQEILEASRTSEAKCKKDEVARQPVLLIELSSSSSESDSDDDSDDDSDTGKNDNAEVNGGVSGGLGGKRAGVLSDGSLAKKKRKLDELGVGPPPGFFASLLPEESPRALARISATESALCAIASCKQFWKAGDYEGATCGDWEFSSGGMDHVRVHPKFLHSNATSHKWALGAFAELLDNSLDEVCNGATYVNIDMLESRKDGSRMLLIEDNGGGMDPDNMRHCMSLGYSAKSKVADTIGQYGNGFKTSTMRLGADVIVFSRCCGKDGKSPTQSIGLLSYTFLRSTGKEDIVVPMLDYERRGHEWSKLTRSSIGDWNRNLETIIQWSPFSSEADLLYQFNQMRDHGTCIIIYNLWEDDQGMLELDFDADPHDIQLRGVNRDEKNIQMSKQFPNSRHFLTYRHSLRSYASILYLRLPPGFRIVLRGKDVEHHNIVNDMMMTERITYRPQSGADGVSKDPNMTATVTIGFVKDAKSHIDVQGFNVYHKNRLIKPFWRLWNAAGSDGRGVIGVLEANFVEPAHDKQGFERTTVLARLEGRLVHMQKNYWWTNCHRIGYAARRNAKLADTENRETSSKYRTHKSSESKKKNIPSSKISKSGSDKLHSYSNERQEGKGAGKYGKTVASGCENGLVSSVSNNLTKTTKKSGGRGSSDDLSHSVEDVSEDDEYVPRPNRPANCTSQRTSARKSSEKDGSLRTKSVSHLEETESQQDCPSGGRTFGLIRQLQSKATECSLSHSDLRMLDLLKQENRELRERLERKDREVLLELQQELQRERDRCKSLEEELKVTKQKFDELNLEQESLIDIFSEERDRREKMEENLKMKIKDASNTIQALLEKVRLLEGGKSFDCKP